MDSHNSSEDKKTDAISKPTNQDNKDYKLKPLENGDANEDPKVFKMIRKGNKGNTKDRRSFLKDSAKGFSGLLAIGGILSSCSDSAEILIECTGDNCTCHTVCTCDTVSDDTSSVHNAVWTTTSTCTCNTVCTCDTVSTSSGGGGGGGSYWYPN